MAFVFNPFTGKLDAVGASATADVVGPSSSTDNAIVRFDGTTGKLIQNSVLIIDDTTGNITGPAAGFKITGGTGTTADLSFQTTSGVGASGADMHFLVGNNGATEAMTILNSGVIGIQNTAPAAYTSLGINHIGVEDESSAIEIVRTVTQTADNSSFHFGVDSGVHWNLNGWNQTGDIRALYGGHAVSGSGGTASNIIGVRAFLSTTGSPNITNYYAMYTTGSNGGSGTVANFYGSQISISAGVGAIQNIIGYQIDNATATVSAKAFVGKINSSATNWNLYMEGSAQNYLGGKLGIETTVPTNTISIGTAGGSKKIWVENTATDVAAVSLTLASGGNVAGTSASNTAGGNMVIQAGLGTGSGTSNILFQNGTTLASGLTLQTMSTKMALLGTGDLGLGTTAPLRRFDVAGSERITGTASSTLTGTADPTASTTLVGSGTLFLTELVIGDRITVNAETRTVTAIATNTSLTVDTAFTDTASAAITKLPAVALWRLSDNSFGVQINDLGNFKIGTNIPDSTTAAIVAKITAASSTVRYAHMSYNGVAGLFARYDDNSAFSVLRLENRDITATTDHGMDIDYYLADNSVTTAILAGTIRLAKEQQWTTTASTRDSYMSFQLALDGSVTEKARITSAGALGIGTGSTVSAKLHSLATTEQLRLGYDASNYASFTISSAGLLTIEPTSNVIAIPAGASTGFAKLGGAIFNSFADVSVGGAETDIYSYTTAASTFGTDGDKVEATYGGNFVTIGTEATQLKVYFAGTAIWDSTAVTVSTGTTSWRVRVELIRVSATVIRYTVSLNTTGASAYVYCTVGELAAITLSNTNILKITGTSSGAGSGVGDIIGKMSQVRWESAA